MMSELLERKWALSFAHVDVDRNGYADEADALALGDQVIAEYGYTEGSPDAERVRSSFRGLWQSIADGMDTDGDGRVTSEEFVAGMRRVLADERGYDKFFQAAVDPVLDLADRDRDGVVSLEEWRKFQAAYGTQPADADVIFELLDADGRGTLSRTELAEALRQFYTSSNPTDPGNHVYGRLF